eukprot:968527-Prorocentrum_minimum.AAC.3
MDTVGLIATSVRGPVACVDAPRARSVRASARKWSAATPGRADPSTHGRATLTRQQLRSHSGIAVPRSSTVNYLRRRLAGVQRVTRNPAARAVENVTNTTL